MSTAGSGATEYAGHGGEDELIPAELRSLLVTISHQIDEADQRHTSLLQEMRDRLSALSRDAETVRGQVPSSAGPAYQRIEDGLMKLAGRIEQSETTAAPAPLRSAAETTKPAASRSGVDPFDLVGEGDDNEPWDENNAEALTRVYESSDAALVRNTPRSETPEPVPAQPPVADEAPLHRPIADTAHVVAQVREIEAERQWLDERLSDIAVRIESSLLGLRPELSVESLSERFEAFEQRMGEVLGDVATRSDVESLRILENHIHELAGHLEQTEVQLGRLDSIEQQLQAVIEHLAEERAADTASAPQVLPDFQALVQSAATEAAARVASSATAGAAQDLRLDEVSGMIRGFMDDRRQNDEQTYSMLDTVQQAMIRLLDRIDALEVANTKQPAPVTTAAPSPVSAAAIMPTYVAAEAPGARPVLPAETVADAPRSTADRMRQDFIADAQRAKKRAAAAAAVEPRADDDAAVVVAPVDKAKVMPRPRIPVEPEPAKAAPGRSKLRLTAIALAVVIAISGASLLMKSRQADAPQAPAQAIELQENTPDPAAAVPAPMPQAAAPQAVPQPAMPQSAAPQPAPQVGAPQSAPAAELPDPVLPPIDGAASNQTRNDVRRAGPQTNESALGFDGEIQDGGLIEQSVRKPLAQPGMTPEGIVLQQSANAPTAQQLAHLQSQQNAATLSSRLAAKVAQLPASALMPEEVARQMLSEAAPAEPLEAPAQPISDVMGMVSEGASALPAIPAAFAPQTEQVQSYSSTTPLNAAQQGQASLPLPPATVGPLSLRMAAANGDPSAAFEVGARLAEGKGTNQNFKEAMTWYQRSAAQGFAQSQYRVGTLYERGLGVKADIGRARMWYQRAAEQGNVKAMHNLAVLSAGRDSASPDYATAAQWFASAAEYGLADSQYNLAVLHENGLGVAQDRKLAYKWYALAARGGDPESGKRRDAIAAQLAPEERQDAESLVTAFVPKRVIPMVNDARVAGEDWKKRQSGGNG